MLLQVDVDTVNGGLKLNPDFCFDFLEGNPMDPPLHMKCDIREETVPLTYGCEVSCLDPSIVWNSIII